MANVIGPVALDPRMPDRVYNAVVFQVQLNDLFAAPLPSIGRLAMESTSFTAYSRDFHDAALQRIALGSASLLGLEAFA
jgi:hypothetical protein